MAYNFQKLMIRNGNIKYYERLKRYMLLQGRKLSRQYNKGSDQDIEREYLENTDTINERTDCFGIQTNFFF